MTSAKRTSDADSALLYVVVADATSSTYDGLRVFAHPSLLRSRKLLAASPVSISLTREGLASSFSLVADLWPRSTLDAQELCMPAALLPDATSLWQATVVDDSAAKERASSPPLASKAELAVEGNVNLDVERAYMLKALAREHLIKAKYIRAGSTFLVDFQGKSVKVRIAAIASAEQVGRFDQVKTTFQTSRDISISLRNPSAEHVVANGTQSNGVLQKERAYATLGGLDSQIEELRKLVEMPLRRPDIFKRYGLQPPRGLLLFGPPGTGKTTLAYSAAKACLPSSSIETISGPELTSSLHGGTERALRKVFDRARKNAPSVVIIDEIDALAPRRDGDADGSGEVEKRVVATLLTLMDGLGNEEDEQARIVVIAATNRPNAIDPALRRPGRLDREIEVGIPSSEARLAILRVLLRKVPHTLTNDELGDIARRTHGYVGADLSALVREAGMHALTRDLTASNDALSTHMDALSISGAHDAAGLCADDFHFAQAKVRPSAMREVTLELPKVQWKEIASGKAGLHVQQAVRECVEWPLKHRETMKRLGVESPRGILLYGPPGCSKTLIARALASESGLNFVAVKGGELINKYVGESERALREIFRKARAASPSIIFFDEIDGLTTSRGSAGGEGVGDRLITTLLTEMDGIEQLSNVLVVAATNRPDVLDPALLRPGRLDKLLYVGPPDVDARRQILALRTEQMALADDVRLDVIAELTQGCSGAEVVSICQDAGLRAMNEDIGAQAVRHAHLEAAARQVRRRITPLMLHRYESWRDQTAVAM